MWSVAPSCVMEHRGQGTAGWGEAGEPGLQEVLDVLPCPPPPHPCSFQREGGEGQEEERVEASQPSLEVPILLASTGTTWSLGCSQREGEREAVPWL